MKSGQVKKKQINTSDLRKPNRADKAIGRLGRAPTPLLQIGFKTWGAPDDVALDGYWTVEDLLKRVGQNSFAFEEVIVRCLLFAAALNPADEKQNTAEGVEDLHIAEQRRMLIGVARMLCALIHDQAGRGVSQKLLAKLGFEITQEQLNDLDRNFFLPLGGPQSLLFAPSVQDTNIRLGKRINELLVPLTIAHYFDCLGWTYCSALRDGADKNFVSKIKQVAKLSSAYRAIDVNVFGFEHDFSETEISEYPFAGPQTPRARPGAPETTRSRVRNAPYTLMLLYHMLAWERVSVKLEINRTMTIKSHLTIADDWCVPVVFAGILMRSSAANQELTAAIAASKRNIEPLLESGNEIVRNWFGFSEAAGWNDDEYCKAPLSFDEVAELHTQVFRQRGRPRSHPFK